MAELHKFVIITMPRTGSNMLGSILDGNPRIACFGELMRKTPDWMLKQGYRGALRILEKVDPVYRDDNIRFKQPYDFINAVFLTETIKPVKGFKLHIEQHPAFLEQLVNDPEFRIILLQRENILAQYSSWKIAQVTGQGNAPKGTEIKQARIKLDSDDFMKYLNKVEKNYDWVGTLLRGKKDRVFNIKYTQLTDNEKIRALGSFLGVGTDICLEPGTEKRNPSDILQRFNNPQSVQKILQKINRAEWAYEYIDHQKDYA